MRTWNQCTTSWSVGGWPTKSTIANDIGAKCAFFFSKSNLNLSDDTSRCVAPHKKAGQFWWRQLLVIKRVTVTKLESVGVRLEFTLPKGNAFAQAFVICDSHVRADHDIGLDVIGVAEGDDSDSDEDMESFKAWRESWKYSICSWIRWISTFDSFSYLLTWSLPVFHFPLFFLTWPHLLTV